jgi:hypothetical protein
MSGVTPVRRIQPPVDAAGDGVLDAGVEPFGGGAPLVGEPPGVRGVVELLPGLDRDAGPGGDGQLGAAGRRMLRRVEDLGPVACQSHRRRPQRAADLAGGGGAGQPAVAVGVLGGVQPELVACQLGCLLVVGGDVGGFGGWRRRGQLQQRLRGGRAVQIAVADDSALVSALGSAVAGLQVDDQLRADAARFWQRVAQPLQIWRGGAVGVFVVQRVVDQPAGVPGLPVGELVRAVFPGRGDAEAFLVGCGQP